MTQNPHASLTNCTTVLLFVLLINAFAEEASSSFASTKERHEKLPREKVVKPLPDRPPFKVPPGPVSAWAAVDVGVRMHYH